MIIVIQAKKRSTTQRRAITAKPTWLSALRTNRSKRLAKDSRPRSIAWKLVCTPLPACFRCAGSLGEQSIRNGLLGGGSTVAYGCSPRRRKQSPRIRFGQAVPKRPWATSLIRLALSRAGEKRFSKMASPSTGLSYDQNAFISLPAEYRQDERSVGVFKLESAYMTCCAQLLCYRELLAEGVSYEARAFTSRNARWSWHRKCSRPATVSSSKQ